MSIPVTLNGITYTIPTVGETNWGQNTTSYLVALGNGGLLSLDGGSFPLLADVNFGPNYGVITPYLKSEATNPASTGVIRLGNTDAIAWRNDSNTGDIPLTVNAGVLTFDGAPVGGGTGLPRTDVTGTTQLAVTGNMYILVNVAATTVTLPLAPSEGNIVVVVPANGLKTNVINPNGETISNVAGSMIMDNPNATVTLQYLNGSWRFIL